MTTLRRRGLRRTACRGRPARAGFTLVELMVSMMILAVGVLGLAATAASVTRNMGGGRRSTIAANIAASRIEKLRSMRCNTLAGGADTARGIVSNRTVTQVPRGVQVTETVSWLTAQGRTRVRVYNTSIPC